MSALLVEIMENQAKSENWEKVGRPRRLNFLEFIVEKGIFFISLSAIFMVLLICVFIFKEAMPIFLGKANSADATEHIAPADMDKIPKEKLRSHLGMSPKEFAATPPENLRMILEVRAEAKAEQQDSPESTLDTTEWKYILKPFQWSGYDKPENIWQPVGNVHKYNIWPLVVGSLKVTIIALLFSVPISLLAAIYVSQLAPGKTREVIKPVIEMLAGIPSIVIGAFALLSLASFVDTWLHPTHRLNAFIAGIALGISVIPVVFSIAEDALTSVPRSFLQAALALGSSKWQAAWHVVVPAALPGIFAAVILGFGRAMGETMIVLMASGNASIMSWNFFQSTRTITATIASEMGETVFGGHHYSMLFMIGSVLFVIAFVSNLAGDFVMTRLKKRMEGNS